jgi:purine-binding chemotaxis protein CheW
MKNIGTVKITTSAEREIVITVNKMAAPAHYLRATILQEQGALPEAIRALTQAVYVEPQFVLGHFFLGQLVLKHGRHQESKKHFENALLLLARCEPEDIVPESEGLGRQAQRNDRSSNESTSRGRPAWPDPHSGCATGQKFRTEQTVVSMHAKDTMPESRTAGAPGARHKRALDWADLHRRLDASESAVQRRLSPSPEEKRKILRERARSLAAGRKGQATPPDLLLEVVEFVLGPEHYGIESTHIREIHPLNEFTPLPCTPAFVLGLANVRGQILSIINIKKLFDLPEIGLTDLNKIIVVHAHHMELGILADAVLGVRSIALEDLRPALPTLTGIRAEYLKGITKDPLVVLDVERILSDEKILVDEVVSTAT